MQHTLVCVLYVDNKASGCALHTHLVWCHGCLLMLCCKVEERCLESWGTVSPSLENPFFIKSTFPEILHLIHCPFCKREHFWFFLICLI